MQRHCFNNEDCCAVGHAHLVLKTRILLPLRIWTEFAPSVRETGRNGNSLAGVCMKKASGRLWMLFCQDLENSLYDSALRKAHHPPPLTPFLNFGKKTP